MAKKPLRIDMIAGSQLRDTQGETLSVEGADISDLENGVGRINDNHGKGFFNSIGRVVSAKKIFKREDCDNERHEYYWDKIKAPYIYVMADLHDDEDHPNARAAAAILRNIHKHDVPLTLKASVEGGVVARGVSDPSLLARTKIHSVALTFTPANNATLVEPLDLDKSSNWDTDLQLIKSVVHLAETNVPSFRHIVRDASATKVQNNLLKLVELMKELGIEGDITIPSKQKILEKALEYKIQDNIQKIHQSISLLNNEENMNKGLKDALVAATTAAGITLAPQKTVTSKLDTPVNKPQPIQSTQLTQPTQSAILPKMAHKPSHREVFRRVAQQYPLLGAIGQIESSGGINFDHAEVTKGQNKGHKAGGMFGMMPLSAADTLFQNEYLAKKYPKLAEAAKDIKTNHKIFTDRFNNDPQAAADFAIAAFKRRQSKTKNDHMLVYSWLNGLKGSWDKYKDKGMNGIINHPYVHNVMQEYDKLKPKEIQQKKPLKKALMAGYGGAGAPTANISGGVIQAESLDQGRDFKYINCDNCGKEQIYAKHQIKCRSCGHSFSLEKLYRTLVGTK